MERDEEIIKASTDTFKEDGDEFSKVVQLFWMSAFISGAKWSDEHPKNVWHSADEEPGDKDWKILCEDEEGGCWVEYETQAIRLHNNWKEYTAIEMVVKWAYISDLLPKQFGISEQLKGGEE